MSSNNKSMVTTRLGNQLDIAGVLALQEKYLFKNLSEIERKNGFVTTPFTASQIEEIILEGGLFIAEDEKASIIAYVFAGSWKYFSQWEIFNIMVARFPNLSFNGSKVTIENSFQYGPICIDEAYRGTGVLQQIFEEMRVAFSKKYPISVTFINQINVISERAHTNKLGWKIIDRFNFNNNQYIMLALDMNISVLPLNTHPQ